MVKKRRVIESESQLLEAVGRSLDTVQCSDQVHSCIGMSRQLVPMNVCFVIISN